MSTATRDSSITNLLDEISKHGSKLTSGDTPARKKLLSATRELFLALETPMETILRWEWAETTLNSALRVASEIKLFEKLAEGDGGPKTSAELAQLTGTHEKLLSRILKHLGSMRVIHETDTDSYSSTTLSKALVEPKYGDGIPFWFDINLPAINAIPTFLANTSYKDPSNLSQSPFNLGHRTDKNFFEYLAAHPTSAVQFNNHMEGYNIGRKKWTDEGCVPVQEVLSKVEESPNGVLLVDVGGGTGRDIMEFQRRYPDLSGRLVLQDLPSVIKQAVSLPIGIEKMAHDFYIAQPIQGAHAYYLHSVLHDWPDDKCQEILKNIIPSMKKGYSKILINENVIPDKDADWKMTALDMTMMACFASKERTAADWKKLLGDVGLKVVQIWTYEVGSESLIEAEVA